MVVMKAPNRRLGLLGAVIFLSSAHVSAYSSSPECYEVGYADGYCDDNNNRAECGYDSGDCCSCTCTGSGCGLNGFACIDPNATCVDDDDIAVEMVENCGSMRRIGDGSCDHINNKAECAYDGGDCCSCTCRSPEIPLDNIFDYSCSTFECIDPEATCVDDDNITVDMFENCGFVRGVGNGHCDQDNNNAECDYDGGDCCSCTCTNPENIYGGYYGCSEFACIDPEAACVDDDDITVEYVEGCGVVEEVGNGFCDQRNNNAGCGYDGGDCCSCTCTILPVYWALHGCRKFACIDPEAACVDDDEVTVDMVENCGSAIGIGNGFCDDDNNNEQCGYDGGDCCECTCVGGEADDYFGFDDVGCGSGFACIDPEAPCVNDDDITLDVVASCDSVQVGNGYCDEQNNNAECGYDGGDCCSCTCEDRPNQKCGEDSGFACVDPEAACVNDDDITSAILENCPMVADTANGFCDQSSNIPECNYDGGDCCECTCDASGIEDEGACGKWADFACIDPAAACVDDDSVTVDMIDICEAGGIGDGYCSDVNNRAECAYDGGDCCSCTCVSPWDELFGCSDFACIDPEAACVNDDDITVDMPDNCDYLLGIGDGYCDQDNNNAQCGYDGGDCCECTCFPEDHADDYSGGIFARCIDFACIDPEAACVDDDDVTVDMIDNCDRAVHIGDGNCDQSNNKAECGYDGGDCCECTCTHPENSLDDSTCNRFACIDPDAACVNDDDFTVDMLENCGILMGVGNGQCDQSNNNEECGWDGGDCCYCTCESDPDDDWACSAGSGFECRDMTAPCYGERPPTNDDEFSMSHEFVSGFEDFVSDFSNVFVPWEQEGSLPTLEGAVEVGTKTEVGVSATAYDVRPGAHGGEGGCGEVGGDGCAPANSRDGISSEVESRWSCSMILVEDEGPCVIEYTFSEPQDIMDIEVAFWRGEERTRTLNVHLDGVRAHTHESYAGSTFNTLGVSGTGVTTVALESVELLPGEWISLLEVLIFVPE